MGKQQLCTLKVTVGEIRLLVEEEDGGQVRGV